jgi:AcrR family transcriptional regulator
MQGGTTWANGDVLLESLRMTTATLERETPRQRKTSKREKTTRDEILEVAAHLIATQGYGACTMRSISKEVEVKAGSLYHHFASKEEIVLEIMNRGASMLLEAVNGAVDKLPKEAPFLDRFRAAVEVHVACKLDGANPYMRVYEHLSPEIKRQGRLMRRTYADFWNALIDQGKEAKDVRASLTTPLFVSYLLSALNHTPEWFNGDHMRINEISDLIVEVTAAGILTADRI